MKHKYVWKSRLTNDLEDFLIEILHFTCKSLIEILHFNCKFNSQCYNQYDEVLAFMPNKKMVNSRTTFIFNRPNFLFLALVFLFFFCNHHFDVLYVFSFSFFILDNQVLLVLHSKLKMLFLKNPNLEFCSFPAQNIRALQPCRKYPCVS